MITITKVAGTICYWCQGKPDVGGINRLAGEAFLQEICNTCLKELKAALDKQPPTISDEQRAELYEQFYPQTRQQLDPQIDDALNHVAVKKAINKFRYVQGWLRRNVEKARPFSGAAAGTRDMSKYYEGFGKRAAK